MKSVHEAPLMKATLTHTRTAALPYSQILLQEVNVFVLNEVLLFTYFEEKIESTIGNNCFRMIKQKENIRNTGLGIVSLTEYLLHSMILHTGRGCY